MNRILIAVLTLIVLFTAVSCTSDQGEESFSVDLNSSSDIDFSGYEFIYLQNGSKNDGSFLSYLDETLLSDAALLRVKNAQEELNFVFQENLVSDLNATLQLLISTGDDSISAVQWTTYSTNAVNCARAGYFLPISEVSDYIDYTDSEKWGDKYLLESL